MHQVIETSSAPAAIGPYSQGIKAGNLLFVSGQLGLDPQTGEMKDASLTGQARQALYNLKSILEAADFKMEHVTAVDVYLVDMEAFGEFNAVYETFFQSHKPARAVVAVKALPKNGLVEIKCAASR